MIYTSSSYIYSVPIIVIIIVIGVVVAAAFGLFSSYITYTRLWLLPLHEQQTMLRVRIHDDRKSENGAKMNAIILYKFKRNTLVLN